MKRIAFLHVASILGGSEKSFLDLLYLNELNSSDVLVIVPEDGPLVQEIRRITPDAKVQFLPLPSGISKTTRKNPVQGLLSVVASGFGFISYLWNLTQILRAHSTDVLYTNGIKCHLVSCVLPTSAAPSIVWHLQDFFPDISFLKTALPYLPRRPQLIIANSTAVAMDTQNSLPKSWLSGPQPIDVRVVPNSVNIQDYTPTPLRPRNEKGPIVVSMIGMLTPWKGQHLFIEAIGILQKQGFQIKGQIAGGEVYSTDGETGYKQLLEKKISELRLQDHVALLGLRSDVQDIIAGSDLCVHCSIKPEPFGRTIIEVMACGRPIVAARAGGVLDIIQHQVNGLLFQPGDPLDLATQIKSLIENPSTAEHLIQNALVTVRNKFSSKQFQVEIQNEIRKIAS